MSTPLIRMFIDVLHVERVEFSDQFEHTKIIDIVSDPTVLSVPQKARPRSKNKAIAATARCSTLHQ